MRDPAAPGQRGYPGFVEAVHDWLHRRPWLMDVVLAAILLAGSANAFGNPAVLPASLALAGAVAVRRSFPVAAYAAALAIGVAQVIFGIGATYTDSPLQPTFADVGILILLYTVAAERPRRMSLPGLAACAALFAAGVARYNPGGNNFRHPVEVFLVTGLVYLVAPLTAWVLGDVMAGRRARSAALEERAVRAERERDAQAEIAAAAERVRIARELHDVIAHSLSVMVAQADGGAYAFDAMPERSRQALSEIGRTGRQALSEMSSLLGVLRAGTEAPSLAPAPAAADIAELVSQAREAGMRVSHTEEGTVRPLPGGLSLSAYRIVQEALTNVRKHAGPAAGAEVTVRYRKDELLVRITNDGGTTVPPPSLPRYGADHPPQPAANLGHGLAGMRERAAMYGGTVQAGPCPGGGFEVTVRLPLSPAGRPTSRTADSPSAAATRGTP
jgi:signal transduction histidine kinase